MGLERHDLNQLQDTCLADKISKLPATLDTSATDVSALDDNLVVPLYIFRKTTDKVWAFRNRDPSASFPRFSSGLAIYACHVGLNSLNNVSSAPPPRHFALDPIARA